MREAQRDGGEYHIEKEAKLSSIFQSSCAAATRSLNMRACVVMTSLHYVVNNGDPLW